MVPTELKSGGGASPRLPPIYAHGRPMSSLCTSQISAANNVDASEVCLLTRYMPMNALAIA